MFVYQELIWEVVWLTGAMSNNGYFQLRIKAQTKGKSASLHSYGYAFVMRRVTTYVRLGTSYGLSEDNVVLIRASERPDTPQSMAPFFKTMEGRVENGGEGELASLFHAASNDLTPRTKPSVRWITQRGSRAQSSVDGCQCHGHAQ